MFGRGNGIDSGLGTDLVMQAVNGNRSAISDLAGRLNCDINSINTAINAVQSSVQNVGSQVGMSGLQVINAIQSGNQTLASQLAQCCCENKLLVTQSNYENQISTLNQTNQLGSKIDANTNTIAAQIAAQTTFLSDKFCDLEKREMQARIDSLLEEKNTLQTNIAFANQTGQIQNYISGIITCVIGLFTVFIGFKDKLLDRVFDEITELIAYENKDIPKKVHKICKKVKKEGIEKILIEGSELDEE